MTTSQIHVARCVLCGPESYRSAFDDAVRQCLSCGLAWTVDGSSPSAELYGREYYSGEGYADYFDAVQRRFEATRRLRWLSTVARPTTLLEAGPAGGFFLEAARGAGIDASGIELSEVSSCFARDQLGVPVRQGYFEAVAPQLKPVDAVCAFHVLEHVDDPRAFLAAARNALVPGGWLALEVPNIASATARRLGLDWPGWALRHHRWHFLPESLIGLLNESGLRVVGFDTVFSRYYWRPWARWRNARSLFVADLAACRSPKPVHPRQGDLLRIFARRVDEQA